jgi:predicted O-methyltransferase YrrM
MSLTRLKGALRRVLGDTATGVLDYLMRPERGEAFGGPFNGQRARVALFESIVAKCSPVIIVETGTYLGTTTEYLAATQLPIYSVEHDRRAYAFAKTRLWRRRNVHLKQGDSREALRAWFDGPLHSHSGGPMLIYLDAHWGSDLPLSEELVVIFDHCSNAIVMIDDFRVPFDNGYGYDDYGDGKALVPAYIEPTIRSFHLRAFYPSTPSAEETGARRGCVVLVREASLIRNMESLPLLRAPEPS